MPAIPLLTQHGILREILLQARHYQRLRFFIKPKFNIMSLAGIHRFDGMETFSQKSTGQAGSSLCGMKLRGVIYHAHERESLAGRPLNETAASLFV